MSVFLFRIAIVAGYACFCTKKKRYYDFASQYLSVLSVCMICKKCPGYPRAQAADKTSFKMLSQRHSRAACFFCKSAEWRRSRCATPLKIQYFLHRGFLCCPHKLGQFSVRYQGYISFHRSAVFLFCKMKMLEARAGALCGFLPCSLTPPSRSWPDCGVYPHPNPWPRSHSSPKAAGAPPPGCP